ncbi:uncharacterized protein LOC108042991 [Drosophila rhopaloa]|uniref:Uncharacterized protein LOC108042991 n=1 Tax=Drosophila rhopaloa TaxID=1041015 RepID=A0A6P4EFT6_DRORH|nr:uncharacterized protein LOC108042991 [Drosophila rhopaloa]
MALKLIRRYENSESDAKTQPKLVLGHLTRAPLQCPLGNCLATISSLDLLVHLKEQHLTPASANDHFHLAFEGERCTLVFDPQRLTPRHTICLGVLLFGGKRGEVGKLPGEQELCHRNRVPPDSGLQTVADHQPVLVLVRKCAFFEWLSQDRDMKSKEEEEEFPNQRRHDYGNPRTEEYLHFRSPHTGKCLPRRVERLDFRAEAWPKSMGETHNQDLIHSKRTDYKSHASKDQKRQGPKETIDPGNLEMYLIWTQSVPSTRPLYASITVHDRTMSEGRSVLRLVTNSGRARPELDGKQLPHSRNSLWLTQGEIEQLSGAKRGLHLEMILKERLEEPS